MGAISAAAGGLREAQGPLTFLRSKNALKVILDVDEDFGRVRTPDEKGWRGIPRIVGGKA